MASSTSRRRIRAPHYITGLGDGNVRKRIQERHAPDDDLFRRHPLFDRTISKPHVRRKRSPEEEYWMEQEAAATNTSQGPWQVSAMALVCVLGLLLALFLQLMSDNNDQQHQKVTYLHKKKKKKTDEWTRDEEVVHLNYNADTEATSSTLYYPPRFQQQQHRHRKVSASDGIDMNATTKKSPVIINSRPYYHHNVSGNNPNAAAAANKAFGASSPSSAKSPPLAASNKRAVVVAASGLEGFEASNVSPQLVRGKTALTLSPVSSFCSLPTDNDESSLDNHNNNNNNSAAPVMLPYIRPQGSDLSALDNHNSAAPVMLPYIRQQGSDLSAASQQQQEIDFLSEDFVTPKAGRRRRSVALPQELIDTAVPFTESQQQPPRDQQQQQQQPQQQILPFLPNLSEHHHDDDLVIARMESGDMAYSPKDPLLKQKNDALIAEAAKAASPGPRNNIVHKRKDLTLATDAGSSLRGSIRFDELQLVRVIGGGGFGQVWEATWRGTPVAVKVASAQVELKSILEEFAAEINMLKGMRHPNICLYMGACLEPPNRAIVTELAANGSLWDALRLPLQPPFEPCNGLDTSQWPRARGIPPQGTWPWALVKRVACGAARGMTYLHSGTPPVLHRDLKSANLLLDDAYTTKVCDFGLSRLKAHQTNSMTGNCGTVQWMAPEVLANQHYAEPADVYSFGIILWELLTGECPYDGMSAIQCALAVLNRNHRPPIPDWCPEALAALITACLNQDPSKRPTFGHVLMALDAMP